MNIQNKRTDLNETDLVDLYPKRKIGKPPKKKKRAFIEINKELELELDRWAWEGGGIVDKGLSKI